MNTHKGKLITFILLGLVLGFSTSSLAMTGAVWTTDSTCGGTNINIFANKGDVYLNGGPTSSGQPGLPPGNYYIKVTTPDGDLLGYTTTASAVVGSDGKFAVCYHLNTILIKNSDGSAGYDNTTNAGSEYKVWASQDPTFPNSLSKTDNFKAEPDNGGGGGGGGGGTGSISGTKFLDLNLNGTMDSGITVNTCNSSPGTVNEPGILNWRIALYKWTGTGAPTSCTDINWTYQTQNGTDGNGDYSFTITETGYYKVVEVFPLATDCGTWTPTPTTTTCRIINMSTLQAVTDQDFANVCTVKGGLTIGYWKTWSGVPKGSKRDATYDSLPITLGTGCQPFPNPYANSNPYTVDSAVKAYDIFLKADSTGDGRKMLAAQLLAAKMNVIKFGGCSFDCALYVGNVAKYNLWSVKDIIAEADSILCDSGKTKADVTEIATAIDQINNNATSSVLVNPTACPIIY